MQKFNLRAISGGLVLLALGFGLGRMDWNGGSRAWAQPAGDVDATEEVKKRLEVLNGALRQAMEAIKQDGKYTPATMSLNAYAILVGGLNVVDDLEGNRGVDPISFAALQIGDAADEVAPHLGRDADGNLTYKNRIVRIYSREKLKTLDTRRRDLAGEAKLPGK